MEQSAKSNRKSIGKFTARVMRWLHIYVSMFSFFLVLFFAVTGITLNHPDAFAFQQKQFSRKGSLNVNWVSDKLDTGKINRLAILDYLRNHEKITASMSEWVVSQEQCLVSYKGPGYAADAFINRNDGSYELSIIEAGWVGIMNDLHKGRDTGTKWAWVIDVAAVFMTIVSLTGILLMVWMKKKRVSGFLIAIAGIILSFVLYKVCIP
ncbi:MAG: peptidase [Chitinophagia bacterium]|nr:peptidase [Chitinophagia bacterium]